MKSLYIAGIAACIVLLQLIFSCSGEQSVETRQYATNGQKLYTTHCQNCHGAKGEGLGRLYPPLTDTAFLNEHRNQLACIVKNGMSGPVEIAGISYNGTMPGVAELTSIEIAYLLTYVTTFFGNSKTHFTQQEVENYLSSCP